MIGEGGAAPLAHSAQTLSSTVFVVVLGKDLELALVCALDTQLVVEVLAGAMGRGGGILDDELG